MIPVLKALKEKNVNCHLVYPAHIRILTEDVFLQCFEMDTVLYLSQIDLTQQLVEKYPSETNEEFPHVKEEITRAHLTTKLKTIRGKYRNSVDTGRRSGHGRMVLLYFELYEQVWGGSPATTTIASDIETNKLEDSVAPSPHLLRLWWKSWTPSLKQ
ncbi:unnamed protein product [Leuciscus chuanchicus]